MGKDGRCVKYIAIHERVSFTNLFLPYLTGILFHSRFSFIYKLLHRILSTFSLFFRVFCFLHSTAFSFAFFLLTFYRFIYSCIHTLFSFSLIPARRLLSFHFLSYILFDFPSLLPSHPSSPPVPPLPSSSPLFPLEQEERKNSNRRPTTPQHKPLLVDLTHDTLVRQ